ncbi:unnamed protein product [Caenorhabditis brenneri]
MHFDSTYPYRYQYPITSKHPYSTYTVSLMRNALDSNDFSEIKKVIGNNLRGTADHKVRSEELEELMEIEMEVMLMKRSYREMAEELNARNYTTRISILLNWIGFLFIVFGYNWYTKHHGPINKFYVFDVQFYFCVFSMSVFGIVCLLDYTPLTDEEDKKIWKRFEWQKKQLKPKIKLLQLLREQKKLLETFLNELVPIRTKYDELWWKRCYLKCHNALPVALFYMISIWKFVSDGLKNGNENGEFHVCILHLSLLVLTIPFFLWG